MVSFAPLRKNSLTRRHSQDTNTTQYQLMKYLAAAHGCVTVVGDPDQSSGSIRSLSSCTS